MCVQIIEYYDRYKSHTSIKDTIVIPANILHKKV